MNHKNILTTMIVLIIVLSAGLMACSPASALEEPQKVEALPVIEVEPTEQVQQYEAQVVSVKEDVQESGEFSENIEESEDCPICMIDLSSYTGPLTAEEIEGLLLAFNDEYHAWAVYDQVIQDHGDVRPFSSIINSEATHIDELVSLFDTYGLPVPENPWVGNVPSFATLNDACQTGVDAEILNVELYDRIFASTEREDIITVYEALQRASNEKHLPAFERCAAR